MAEKYIQTTISEPLHAKIKWLAFRKNLKIRQLVREALEQYVQQIPPDVDVTSPPEVTAQ